MLRINFERAIFIIVFIMVFIVLGIIGTQIKINVLGINGGKTPEQVIEETYPDIVEKSLKYKYINTDDFLFVVRELETGYCNLI